MVVSLRDVFSDAFGKSLSQPGHWMGGFKVIILDIDPVVRKANFSNYPERRRIVAWEESQRISSRAWSIEWVSCHVSYGKIMCAKIIVVICS